MAFVFLCNADVYSPPIIISEDARGPQEIGRDDSQIPPR